MRRSKSLNFLLELLLVIVLFTFCSIVFVNLFVNASKMNKSAEVKYQASLEVESIVEQIRINGTYEISDSDDYVIEVQQDGNDYIVKASDQEGKELEEIKVKYVE